MTTGIVGSKSLKAMKGGLLAAVMLATAVQTSFAADVPSALPAVSGDGAGAISRRVEDAHRTRYIEIFLATREPGTGQLVAACFNAMYTSRGAPRRETPLRRRWSRASISTR